MGHFKLIGLAAVLIIVLGLSGCDSSNDDSRVSPPVQPQPDPNPGEDTNNSDVVDQNETVDDGDQNETVDEEVIEKVDTPINPEYTSYTIENGAHALTNNGRYLVYGTIDGLLYTLDVETGASEFLYDLNDDIPNILIGGLAYIGDNEYYYGAAHNSTIRRLNIVTGESHIITDNIFPDGIDYFNGYIYSVTNNMDDRLTVFDTDGNIVTRISTGIEDFVAIAHSDHYLYILSEQGDIYQVNPDTGDSHMVVHNTEFEGGDSFGGVEGLDILDHHLYMTNVNDSKIYRVEIDVRAFE